MIEFVYDPRPYGLYGWVDVALSGQTTQCLLEEIGSYTALKPAAIMLYIGGNDTDRGVFRDEICSNYEQIVSKFIEQGIVLILHELHYGLDERRSHLKVEAVNNCINRIGLRRQIQVIKTPETFRYANLGEAIETSIDGEHLNHSGYAIWMRYLSENLPSIEAGPAF